MSVRESEENGRSDITMNKTRPKTMLIRLSEEEYNQVKQDIEASGMNQQDWLLFKVMSPDIQPVDDYDPFDDDELQVECKDGSYHLMNEKTEV